MNVQVILLQDVKKIGRKYDTVKVSQGYANNFLMPKKLAVAANSPQAKQILAKKSQHAAANQKQLESDSAALHAITGKVITISAKANESDQLYAALTDKAIITAINEQATSNFGESVLQLDNPIKEVGEHELVLKAGEIEAKITLKVAAE